jgi:hypothetical protein
MTRGTYMEPNEQSEFNRRWWYSYWRHLLNLHREEWRRELCEITAEGEALGFVRPGVPADRRGAEDLAAKCDDLKKRALRCPA